MKLRRCGDCPSDVDVELLDRLKSWRAAEASKQQVPAYVVFTDATLTAIAEQRPADRRRVWSASRASVPASWSGTATRCWLFSTSADPGPGTSQ